MLLCACGQADSDGRESVNKIAFIDEPRDAGTKRAVNSIRARHVTNERARTYFK